MQPVGYKADGDVLCDDGKLSGAVRALDAAVKAIDHEADANLESPGDVCGSAAFREPLLAAARLVIARWSNV